MNPEPKGIELSFMTTQQSVLVSEEAHTYQSQVGQQNAGADVIGWNAEYTIYESKQDTPFHNLGH
jgi:hypothetical protein